MAETKTATTNLKLRFNKILSSFTSCNSQNMIPRVITHQTPAQLDHSHSPLLKRNSDENPFVSPKSSKPYAGNYPSLCRPRCPETFDGMVRDSARFRHLDSYYHYSLPPSRSRRIKSAYKEREKTRPRRTRTRKKRTHLRKGKNGDGFSIFPLIGSSNDEDWFSSDDEREDDREPLFSSFSSKSFSVFSSNDSDSNHPPSTLLSVPRSMSFRGKGLDNDEAMTPLKESGGGVKGSFAVVKSSCDPHKDFRESMVEMIAERQMFGAKELERLLRCFLCLNDQCHHRVIVEVFAEILETLFPHISGNHG